LQGLAGNFSIFDAHLNQLMSNKVFITGANGMLGASVTREAIAQGYQVKAQILPGSSTAVLDGFAIEIVEGNILDTTFLDREMDGCQYVINIAALTTIWPRRLESLYAVNLQGVKNIAACAQKYKYQRMVQIGTANSFNHGSKEAPGDENQPYTGTQFKMDYMDSKYQAQCHLLAMHQKANFPVIIVNPTFMIGPYDSGLTSGRMFLELYKNNLPGYAGGGKNFVYSKDVAVATVNALKMGREGQCYIVGNENLYFGEIFRKASVAFGKPFLVKKFPSFAINIIGAINSIFARIFRKTPKLSYSMAKMASVKQFYSPQKARTELFLPSTPVEVAVSDCINWYKANGYLPK
jgi:dihydroflavonol-4-reductase